MIEEASFNAFIKAKLEESVELPEVKAIKGLTAIKAGKADKGAWRSWPWRTVARPALAASLASVIGVWAWRSALTGDSLRERQVAQTIEFLEAWQSLALGEAAGSSQADPTMAERLMNWQDAPYFEIAEALAPGEESISQCPGEGNAPNPAGA